MDQRLPPPARTGADLYEADYYAWVRAQVDGLRMLSRSSSANLPLDLDNLADEVEDRGRSALRGVLSLIEQVLIHLLKIQLVTRVEPHRDWRREVTNSRRELREEFTPSMRFRVLEALPDRYLIARNRVISALEAEILDVESRIPEKCPWTLEQILATDDPDRV